MDDRFYRMLLQHMKRAIQLLVTVSVAASCLAEGAGSSPWVFAPAGRVTYVQREHVDDLWRTDGTAAGTFRVSPAGVKLFPYHERPVVMGGDVYFLATDADTARLWKSDGIHEAEIVYSFDGMRLRGLTASGSRLFLFSRSRSGPDCVRLWTSDGTANGTHVLTALLTDDAKPVGSDGKRFFFLVYTGPFEWDGSRSNYDLWTSDGTAPGTYPVFDGMPGRHFTAAGLQFFTYGNQLWRTDGTLAGTFPLADAIVKFATADALYFTPFIAGWNSDELWKTDGTREGTVRVRKFADWRMPDALLGSRFVALQVKSGPSGGPSLVLELRATNGSGELASLRTLALRDYYSYSYRQIGGLLFVYIATPEARELWRTDGTSGGTILLRRFPSSEGFYNEFLLSSVGSRLLFWTSDGVHGHEPWLSDGTPQGTRLVANIVAEALLHGRVTDAATGAPLRDAVIEIRRRYDQNLEATVAVDENGEYRWEGAVGDAVVRARSLGLHQPQSVDVGLRSGDDVRLDFALHVGGAISGRVVGPDGRGVEGATVNVARSLQEAPRVKVTTDADGRYATGGVAPGEPWILYTSGHPGLSAVAYDGVSCAAGCENASGATPITVKTGESRSGVDFHLERYGSVIIKTINPTTGLPASSSLTFYRVGTPISFSTVVARVPSGTAVVLADGMYWVHVSTPGYPIVWYPDTRCGNDCRDGPKGTPVSPVAGKTTTLEMTLPRP